MVPGCERGVGSSVRTAGHSPGLAFVSSPDWAFGVLKHLGSVARLRRRPWLPTQLRSCDSWSPSRDGRRTSARVDAPRGLPGSVNAPRLREWAGETKLGNEPGGRGSTRINTHV